MLVIRCCVQIGGGAQDYFEFSETIYDYILLVGSCKVAMTQRQEVNKVYLATVQSLDSKKKREAAIKADPKKSALKEKVDAAAQEVKEAEARVKKVHSCPPFTSSNSILGTVPWTQTLSAASPPRLPAGACLRCPCPCHTSCVSYVFSAPSLRRRTRSSDTYLCPPPTKSELRRFQAKEDLIKISKLLRRELERFDYVKVQEFSALCISYIESVMTMEHQICKAWEAFLPEAKALQV